MLERVLVMMVLLLGGMSGPVLAGDQPRIAVLEMQGKLPPGQLAVMSDKVRTGVLHAMQGRDYVVMSRENMAVLAKDMGLDLSCVEGSCEVETGRNIGAAYVVTGSIQDMGGLLLGTLKVHNTDSGALLSTGEVRGDNVMDLVDALPQAVVQMMARALPGQTVATAIPTATPGAAVSDVDFGGGGGLGVTAKLKAQACDKEAADKGKAARAERLQVAIDAVQDKARTAWQGRASELEACTKLEKTSRGACVESLKQWQSVAGSMPVSLSAGVESVQTACGQRQPAYAAERRTVVASDYPASEKLLARLQASAVDAGPKPVMKRDASSTQRAAAQTAWKDCGGGDLPACVDLGYLLAGGAGMAIDASRAVGLYKQACKQKVARGCTLLGVRYQAGHGVVRSDTRAVSAYKKACDGGHGRGCLKLTTMYEKGLGVRKSESTAERLSTRAVSLSEKSCQAGDAGSCTTLGYLYSAGKGVRQSDSRAAELEKQGCDGGDARGCSNLGWDYQKGKGVPQSDSRAAELYKQGCDGGYAAGCGNLGVMYDNGKGVRQSKSRGAELFKQACDAGDEQGCKNLKVIGR